MKPLKQMIDEAWQDYWQFVRKWWKWAFLGSFIFNLCWMVVDATQHPTASAVICK